MNTKRYVRGHFRLTKYQYERLKDVADNLNMSVSKALNILIPKLSKLVDRDFDLKIDYSDYLTVMDKVGYDEELIISAHLSITKENHLFLRNIKNRNYRVSLALLIRLLIEELLVEEEGIELHHSPISYAACVLLTSKMQIILPLPEGAFRFLL